MKTVTQTPIYFLGMGGFAKEVLAAWQDFDLAQKYAYAGFFDDDPAKQQEAGYQGDLSAIEKLAAGTALLLVFTAPEAKSSTLDALQAGKFLFPNAIHLKAQVGSNVKLGVGNIISAGCILTTEIVMGDFNMLNHYVTIGHHARIGTGNALMTKAHISGHVALGDFNLLAVGASILQGKGMGNGNILGSHACLMHIVSNNQSYFGTPALVVK